MKIYQVLNESGYPAFYNEEINPDALFLDKKQAEEYIKFLQDECGLDDEEFTIETLGDEVENITYYLFGQEAVREYYEGDLVKTKLAIIKGDGALYAHNENTHSSVLVDQMDGWSEAATISQQEYKQLN